MDIIDIVGYVAAFLTTSAFIPQVIKSGKSDNLKAISLEMYLLTTVGMFSWFIYGLLVKSTPIIVANVVTTILASRILYLKLKSKRSKPT